jgi:hypothetical protein
MKQTVNSHESFYFFAEATDRCVLHTQIKNYGKRTDQKTNMRHKQKHKQKHESQTQLMQDGHKT